MKSLYFLILFLLINGLSYSQVINGTVKSQQGKPIAGATVIIFNSSKATATDMLGNYRLKLPSGNYQILVSAIGFASQVKSFILGEQENHELNFILPSSDHQLDQVVVTAEKKQQDVQAVPASISVLDVKQIREYRLWDITGLTALSPSLFTVEHGNSASSNFLNIRGVMGFSNEQAVATYVDGVYQFDYFSAPIQFNDIQRIEILRGPQGTLYGRNAFGGVVNITTKQPGNQSSGYTELTFGNYGQQRYTASLSGPVVANKLFAGGSFTYNKRGSIYYNEFTQSGFDSREDYSGNFNLRYLPSAKWSLALNAKVENDNDKGSFPWVGSYDQVLSKPFQVNTNNTNTERRKNYNASLAVNYYGKDFNFTSVSSYIDWHAYYEGAGVDYDFSPLDALSTAPDQRQRILTQEIRFSSATQSQKKLQWVAGAYGFTQGTNMNAPTFYGPDYLVFDPGSNAPFTSTNISKGRNNGFAFFGQATYSLSNNLDFTVGIRYDREKRALDQSTTLQKGSQPADMVSENRIFSAKFSTFTPKAVLSYKLQENMLIYGSYARGFRAGGLNTNAVDPAQVPYAPEQSDNFEIGWKNMFFEHKLKVNLTAFYLKQHNQQISTAMDGINALILNVGEMRNKGIELELTALPLKGLQVDWNASFSRARYASLLLYSSAQNAIVDFEGNQPINTPPVSSMLAAQYTYDFAGNKQGLSVFGRVEYRYLGRYYFDFINDLSQPGYSLSNFKAGIATRKFEFNGWLRNAGNARYVAYGSFGSFMLGSPKTYGITLIAKY